MCIAAEAEADGFAAATQVQARSPWITSPDGEQLVQGTLELVALTLGLRSIDRQGETLDPFLTQQTYAATASTARYHVLFVAAGEPLGQLYFDEQGDIDFADMLSMLCHLTFTVTHADGSPFAEAEHAEVEALIEGDLYYDYSEEELDLTFDRTPDSLSVEVFET
jgi:hypothetical protein